MTVTRDDVIHTAIQLLDEVGLDNLTLRVLAVELGISAPTLYWHVRDKRQLLDLMAEAIVDDFVRDQPPIPDDLEWWERIAEHTRRYYFAIIAHRDGARVIAGNRPTEARLPAIERYLGLWRRAGFPARESLLSIFALINYVIGSALEHQAEAERARRGIDEMRKTRSDDAEARFPLLLEAVRQVQATDRHQAFEHGLAVMIAGLKARHAELAGSSAHGADGLHTHTERQKAGQ